MNIRYDIYLRISLKNCVLKYCNWPAQSIGVLFNNQSIWKVVCGGEGRVVVMVGTDQ
jgi:hypothetical protein